VPDHHRYEVERDTTDAFGEPVASTTPDTTFVDWPLEVGEEYFYRVSSVDLSGLTSDPSETLSVVGQGIAPAAPRGLKAESDPGAVLLRWDPNTETDIEGYVVYRDTIPSIDAADSLAFAGANAFVDTFASLYRLYWYSVSARDTTGLESTFRDTVAGMRAPGGVKFVDCGNSGFENGTYDHPFDMIQEGVDASAWNGAVAVLPGSCEGDVTVSQDLVLKGVGGPAETMILTPAGIGFAVGDLSDAARIEGFTIDGLGGGSRGLHCVRSDLAIEDCVFRGTDAGALFADGSSPTISNCAFDSNTEGVVVADSSRPFFSGCTFEGNAVAHVRCDGGPGPVLGGSLEDANDFLDLPLFMIWNTGTAEIEAEYNYWGDQCVLAEWFVGAVDWSPWTDETHTEAYTECWVNVDEDALPTVHALSQGFPNPFNPRTLILYDVPAPGGRVAVRVYSAGGKRVRTLVDRDVAPGRHAIEWDGTDDLGKDVASGVYFSVMEARHLRAQSKLVLLR